MTVRPARLTDLDGLLRLEQAFSAPDRLDRQRFTRLLTGANALTFVVDSAAAPRLAGYLLLLFRRGTKVARVYSLAVDPAVRQHGLGRLLLAAAEQAARERGCEALHLEVRESNAAAIRLYEGTGYRPLVFLPDYYGAQLHGVRYRKELSAGAPDGFQ
jgi:ribosomal protein S18 acetylase RimI-like enzyme